MTTVAVSWTVCGSHGRMFVDADPYIQWVPAPHVYGKPCDVGRNTSNACERKAVGRIASR